MDEKKVEGIVLKAIPFKETDRILNLFTPDLGVISLYVGRISKKRSSMVNLTSPLCRGEFVLRKGRSDLYSFVDGAVLDLHLPLRSSYSHLMLGGKMLNAISTSQMQGKPAPALYALLTSYLKQLPHFPDPGTLWVSFQLKLLKHEGLLALEKTCTSCSQKEALRLTNGESRCIDCSNELSFPFTSEEWSTLLLLADAKQFASLKTASLSAPAQDAIEAL